ncbi:thioesterase II family protein [Kitasatospora sp. NPDC006697]|uniref:thioesterase II family protein n=1 Tax=Kitasatospora sp. NPDC006697 TaxID=3364020 RepID=UPI0036A589CB
MSTQPEAVRPRPALRFRPTQRSWLVRSRRVADPALRVVCLPHIGGGAALYSAWADRLPPRAELCAVRLPGRENRFEEPPIEDMPALLDGLEEALAPLLDRPYLLFGHCSGSLIAFHLTRRLRAAGRPLPARLVVTSIEAPAGRVIEDPLHLLPRPELFRRFADYGGIAHDVLEDPELMAVFEPTIRADYRLVERVPYTPEPALEVPLTVIGGVDDRFTPYESLAAWRHETTETFSLHLLKTGHFVLDEAAGIVARLVADLEESQS